MSKRGRRARASTAAVAASAAALSLSTPGVSGAASTSPGDPAVAYLLGRHNPALLTELDGSLYFRGYDGSRSGELWKSDGTAAGTHLVADVGHHVRDLTAVGGLLYFTADDGVHGRELWRSDGTAEGTSLVRDIYPGRRSPFAPVGSAKLTDVGGIAYLGSLLLSTGRSEHLLPAGRCGA